MSAIYNSDRQPCAIQYVEPVVTEAQRAAIRRGTHVLVNPEWKPRKR